MKALVLACIALASLALGAPSTTRASGVTLQQLNSFKLYAQWSAAASCNSYKSAGEPVTCAQGECSLFESHNATVVASFGGLLLDPRGFIAVDPVAKQIVVSFRGSTSVRNWVANFLVIQVPCFLTRNCLVHLGFYLSWGEVSDDVRAGIRAALAAHPGFAVVVTGHSLGGALATLAAAHLRADDDDDDAIPADLYTYGAPRVGNLEFARFVSGQGAANYRLTHTDDPVPRLPPIHANYRHVSPEYWIREGSDKVVALDEIEYCAGHSNVECNGGTKGLDLDAHLWYFQGLYPCSPTTPLVRKGELSDEELAAKLNKDVDLDVEMANNLHAEGKE